MADATSGAPPSPIAQQPAVVLQTPVQQPQTQTPVQQPQGGGPRGGTPGTPLAAVGNSGSIRAPTQRTLTFNNSPQRPAVNEGKGLSKAVAALGRDMSSEGILKELKWQTKLEKVKEKVMTWTIPAVFGLIKKGSPYVNLLHSAAYFAGNDFVVAEYQNENIGFMGDRMIGVDPHAIVIEDKAWAWEKATVAT